LANVDEQTLPSARIPLVIAPGFSWRAVAAVMAEKFGLRGLRITAMIGFMIGYFWWRGCDGVLCVILYVFAATTLLLAIIIVWTAKEALDKFAQEHASGTWLTLDSEGVGGEVDPQKGHKSFKMKWTDFRRVVERNRFWLLETVHGSWMVLPTTDFNGDAWAIMRANAKVRTKERTKARA
jgi:hypothetical protein